MLEENIKLPQILFRDHYFPKSIKRLVLGDGDEEDKMIFKIILSCKNNEWFVSETVLESP